eukprot:CAMPEP_0179861362 /NCGR_PEP_ID=MMETSP0982-20121206/14210_1 /TAXON_ID=483367 /ORGANISM="non described non described, Strain CCMP 2436" /LENGTH=30 /DNA_ID= /DNA_START= /DNA_END= /DNA_ORIENTATION=
MGIGQEGQGEHSTCATAKAIDVGRHVDPGS